MGTRRDHLLSSPPDLLCGPIFLLLQPADITGQQRPSLQPLPGTGKPHQKLSAAKARVKCGEREGGEQHWTGQEQV